MKQKFLAIFPALSHKNFQLYFFGQSISLIGTHFQMVAEGWLVLQLTHSAFWVGLVAGLSTLPFLVVTPLSGWLIDRVPRKKILFFTSISSAFFAFMLAILTMFQIINVYEVIVLAFLLGISNAIDVPTRQSFMIEMVGKEDVSSAVALQAGIFNLSRIIGPITAGILIALTGVGGAFLVNSLSFIVLAFILILMKIKKPVLQQYLHPLKAFLDGLAYVRSHRQIRTLFTLMTTAWFFFWPYVAIMPVITQNVFHGDASTLGYLYSFSGVGGFLGMVFVSVMRTKLNPFVFIGGGSIMAFLALVLFSLTSNLYLAFFLLFLGGFGFVSGLATTNGIFQYVVDDSIRGRVTSLYVSLQFVALTVGNFLIGYIAEHYDGPFAIRTMSISAILIFGLFWLSKRPDKLFTPIQVKEAPML